MRFNISLRVDIKFMLCCRRSFKVTAPLVGKQGNLNSFGNYIKKCLKILNTGNKIKHSIKKSSSWEVTLVESSLSYSPWFIFQDRLCDKGLCLIII